MTLFIFLTVVQGIVAAALVGVILMQRSEGGGLGIGGGGGPGGLMSARGAADLLTRTTKWLAIAFVTLSIVLAVLAISATSGREIDDSLDRSVTPQGQGNNALLPSGEAAPAADAAAPADEAAPAEEDGALQGIAD